MENRSARAQIFSASAGSGKTFRLAYNYLRDVIENPAAYRNIIAVTFTNKATEEMKSRIIQQLHRLADNQPSDYLAKLRSDLGLTEQTIRERAKTAQTMILHDYSRFTILTIDTFFQRVLRAFIRELGLELDFSLELDTDTILQKSAEVLIKSIDSDPQLRKWLEDFGQEQLDQDKNWDISRDLQQLGGEIFKEQNKEAFSRKIAKDELKKIVNDFISRAEASKQYVKDIARQALDAMQAAGADHSDFIRSSSTSFIKFLNDPQCDINATMLKCAESVDNWFRKGKREPAAESVAGQLHSLLVQILAIRSKESKCWNTAAAIQKNFRSFALLGDLYDAANAICRDERMLLLSETKHLLSKFITDSDAPFIYEKIGTQFDRFMIDEFQDTSFREWSNFLPLLRNAMAQSDKPSVLLVGDIKQAIYRWRGGDRKILSTEAAEALGKDNIRIESLQDNYRSLPVIVDFNNMMIDKVVKIDNSSLNALLYQAADDKRISQAIADELTDSLRNAYADFKQQPQKRAEYDGFVDIAVYENEAPVIERIKEIIDRGFKPKDIMILVRDKTEGARIAEKLLAFKHTNDNPRYVFDVMTQDALVIGKAPVAKFVTAALALAVNPEDDIQRAVFRRFGDSESIDTPLSEDEKAFFRSIRMLSPEEAFERIVMKFSLDKQSVHTAYLQALHERIARFSTGKVADIGMWLDRWAESEHKKSLSVEQGETTIEIITIHKAKGLEKKVVIIPSCDWDLQPKSKQDNYMWERPTGDKELEKIGVFPASMVQGLADSHFAEGYYRELTESHIDNINLLYVALTRPVESMHIFIKEPPKKGSSEKIGKLVLTALAALGLEFENGKDGCRHIRFGEFEGPCEERLAKAETAHMTIGRYTTRMTDMRLALPSARYFEEDPSADLSPRNFGILMHRAFAEAKNSRDITAAVKQLAADAVISKSEAAELRKMVDKAMQNPLVRSWFDDENQTVEVRNENDIVRPSEISSKRPDRVIIKGNSATVVDYKFGHGKRAQYIGQINGYKELMRQMGYTEVKGYIWYVTDGEVIEV